MILLYWVVSLWLKEESYRELNFCIQPLDSQTTFSTESKAKVIFFNPECAIFLPSIRRLQQIIEGDYRPGYLSASSTCCKSHKNARGMHPSYSPLFWTWEGPVVRLALSSPLFQEPGFAIGWRSPIQLRAFIHLFPIDTQILENFIFFRVFVLYDLDWSDPGR